MNMIIGDYDFSELDLVAFHSVWGILCIVWLIDPSELVCW